MYSVLRSHVQRLRGGGVHPGARLYLRNARYIKPSLEASQDLPAQVFLSPFSCTRFPLPAFMIRN
jgi:hypothetical protein